LSTKIIDINQYLLELFENIVGVRVFWTTDQISAVRLAMTPDSAGHVNRSKYRISDRHLRFY